MGAVSMLENKMFENWMVEQTETVVALNETLGNQSHA